MSGKRERKKIAVPAQGGLTNRGRQDNFSATVKIKLRLTLAINLGNFDITYNHAERHASP